MFGIGGRDSFVQLVGSPLDLAFGASLRGVPDPSQEAPLGPLRLSTGLFLHIF
jgi:hypothetical protein